MAVKTEFKALRMRSGKIAVGKVTENDTHYHIVGAFLVFKQEEGDYKTQLTGVRSHIEPFSPVGGPIGEMNLPRTQVEGEIILPPHIRHSVETMICAEVDNKERRNMLLSRPIPVGTSMTPEDALSKVAKHIEANGKLPDGSFAHSDGAMGLQFGSFRVQQESPYRVMEKADD